MPRTPAVPLPAARSRRVGARHLARWAEPTGRARVLRLRGQAGRGSGAHRLVPAHQGVGTGEPTEGCVWREVLLDLLDRRPTAESCEVTDQLDVGEVARGKRVRIPASGEPQALDRP